MSVVDEAGFLHPIFLLCLPGCEIREISEGMEKKRRTNSVQKADKELGRVGIKTKEQNKAGQ